MALPNKTDLSTLDYFYLGNPFCDVEAKALTTNTLDYFYLGQPFVGAAPAAAGGGFKAAWTAQMSGILGGGL